MKPLALIVEDDEPLTIVLRYNLEAQGFAVRTGRLPARAWCPLPKAEFEAVRKAALAGETTTADALTH